jgi:uncharacterized protein YfaS (alpha-2-macroglobulin family)
MVSSGFQRLAMLQQNGGGWGWWGHGESNGWITAYVVSGLAQAHEAGHPVPQEMFNSGMESLWGHLKASQEPNEGAYLLYALSRGCRVQVSWAAGTPEEIQEAREGIYHEEEYEALRDGLAAKLALMKPHARALMALVLQGDGKDAKPALALLAEGIRDTGTQASVKNGQDYGWLDDGAEASAVALRAFLRIDPKNPLVPKLANGLSLARRGPWWTSTRQTAMAVLALVDYLALTGEHNPDLTLSVSVNGERICSERVTKENWAAFDGVRKIPASRLKTGVNEIVIEGMGSGSPSYAVSLRYQFPAEKIAASQGPLRIDRRYSRIVEEAGQRVLVALRDGEAVASGEEIEVTLRVIAAEAHEWLMLDDPLPAGFEPVREYWGYFGWGWDYWYDHKEFHDDRVSMAMGSLDVGERTVSYTMRAETPGEFHALPARLFDMYHPERSGHSAETRVKVVERK